MTRLLLCAIDGALVETGTTNPLPGVRERLRALRAQGVAVAVVTNQGGVGCRYAHEQRGDRRQAARYPTLDDVRARLAAVAAELPITHIYMCLHHGRRGWPIPEDLSIAETDSPAPMRWSWRLAWRKPQPGMLMQALQDLGIGADDALMVGNRSEDQEAAGTMEVEFRWGNDFFAESLFQDPRQTGES